MDKTINDILRSAEQHGIDSEPDHEAGDLQEALRIAWGILTPEQKKRLTTRYFSEVADQDDEPPRRKPKPWASWSSSAPRR